MRRWREIEFIAKQIAIRFCCVTLVVSWFCCVILVVSWFCCVILVVSWFCCVILVVSWFCCVTLVVSWCWNLTWFFQGAALYTRSQPAWRSSDHQKTCAASDKARSKFKGQLLRRVPASMTMCAAKNTSSWPKMSGLWYFAIQIRSWMFENSVRFQP